MTHRWKDVLGIVVLTAAVAGTSTRADIIVGFAPPAKIVGLGDFFTVDIVADIPAAEPILVWGLDLTIADPAIASLTGPPEIGSEWFPAFSPDGDGLAGLAFPTGVSGIGVVLATLSFSADAIGDTYLFLSITPGDPTEGFGLDPMGFANVIFEPGHLQVVPEPSALLLGGLGWGLIALLTRPRRYTRAGPTC
jgi:hypothetical protein